MNATLPVMLSLRGAEDVLIPMFAIFAIFVVPAVALVLIVWMVLGRSRRADPKVTAEEVRLMQEIHQGLARMDRRIESLETLVLDAERARKSQSGRETP